MNHTVKNILYTPSVLLSTSPDRFLPSHTSSNSVNTQIILQLVNHIIICKNILLLHILWIIFRNLSCCILLLYHLSYRWFILFYVWTPQWLLVRYLALSPLPPFSWSLRTEFAHYPSVLLMSLHWKVLVWIISFFEWSRMSLFEWLVDISKLGQERG